MELHYAFLMYVIHAVLPSFVNRTIDSTAGPEIFTADMELHYAFLMYVIYMLY